MIIARPYFVRFTLTMITVGALSACSGGSSDSGSTTTATTGASAPVVTTAFAGRYSITFTDHNRNPMKGTMIVTDDGQVSLPYVATAAGGALRWPTLTGIVTPGTGYIKLEGSVDGGGFTYPPQQWSGQVFIDAPKRVAGTWYEEGKAWDPLPFSGECSQMCD